MRNRGAAIYRDTLMERAWGGDAETTRAVDTCVARLRKKLNWGDKIETVYQIGYRLKQDEARRPPHCGAGRYMMKFAHKMICLLVLVLQCILWAGRVLAAVQ